MSNLKTPTVYFALILSAAIVFQASNGLAARRETTKAPYSDGDEGDSSDEITSSTSAMELIIGQNTYRSKFRSEVPTMLQCQKGVCSSRATSNRNNLCHYWPTAQRSFEAAAQALGVPAAALVCVMKVESSLQAGRKGSSGDSGLMQFTPPTARDYERKMNKRPEYRAAWNKYRTYGGTDRSVSAFTADKIRSGSISAFDVQIFATAMYFRETIRNAESVLARLNGRPPEPNRAGFRKTMHYLIASYNAGSGRSDRYLRSPGESAVRGLPRVTQKYFKSFDNCISNAATR